MLMKRKRFGKHWYDDYEDNQRCIPLVQTDTGLFQDVIGNSYS